MLHFHLKDPVSPAKGCVIWMHGLGADASDMAGLASQPPLAGLPLRHVFIEAPVRPITLNAGMRMRAWYDIYDCGFTNREDRQGVTESHALVLDIITSQIKAGFREDQIILAGFSQGGAMALYTALHCDMALGGVISLSAYLPMASECQPGLPNHTPIFLGLGQFDAIVLPEWTNKSAEWLKTHGYHDVTVRQYPMEHCLCAEEIKDLTHWLSVHVHGEKAV